MDVLLIEDDRILGKMICLGLEESGHQCKWLVEGSTVLSTLNQGHYDVVVLDRMLPDLSGMEILEHLKQASSPPPVLMLTALGSVENRIEGLAAGADDYLVKPFDFAELVARLLAITRRSRRSSPAVLEVGPLIMDLTRHVVTRAGKEIELTPTEFEMLELLMRQSGEVVTRKMICQHLWDAYWEGVTNVVEVHVTRLRGKIDRDFEFPLLHTVRGRGYVIQLNRDTSG